MACKYCSSGTNDFVQLNAKTVGYSLIEISMDRLGELRARALDDDGNIITQEIIQIQYCPKCGDPIGMY